MSGPHGPNQPPVQNQPPMTNRPVVEPFGDTHVANAPVLHAAYENYNATLGIYAGRDIHTKRENDSVAAREANFNPLGHELSLHGLKSIGWLTMDAVTGNHPHRAEAATPGRRVAAAAKAAGLIALSPFMAVGAIGTMPGRYVQNRRRGHVDGNWKAIVPQRGQPPRKMAPPPPHP